MSVIPQSSRASRGLRPWAPYQGSALYPLGTLSDPQTPHLLTPPLTTNPGSAPGTRHVFTVNDTKVTEFTYYKHQLFMINFVLSTFTRYLMLTTLYAMENESEKK
jgi:hypothetical protein